MICTLQEKVKSNLIAREMTYENFIQKLAEGQTNGVEIAILTLCEMFDILIIVLFERFIWKSDKIPLDEFDICLVVFSKGRYMSATRRDDSKVEVDIPSVLLWIFLFLEKDFFQMAQKNDFSRKKKKKCLEKRFHFFLQID